MQSLGHHSASFFPLETFLLPSGGQHPLPPTHSRANGDGPAGSTSVDGPERTGNNEGTAGLCWKVLGFLGCGPLLASS